MKKANQTVLMMAVVALVSLTLLASSGYAQITLNPTKSKPVYIQAQAFGTSTQMGQTASVTIIIEEFSTPEDQKALMGAFNEKGNEGMVNALKKMHTKGRVSITGTLGYEVSYFIMFPQPDGTTKLRMVANRQIRFGEAWSDSDSMDYNLSAFEIILSKDKKGKIKGEGTMAPRCQFKLNKEGKIEIELTQNEYRLADVMIR